MAKELAATVIKTFLAEDGNLLDYDPDLAMSKLESSFSAAIDEAVEAEREAIAQLADQKANDLNQMAKTVADFQYQLRATDAEDFARDIRARSEKGATEAAPSIVT